MSEHRHLLRSLLRAVLLVGCLIVTPALVIEGDLLVLPAVGLVLLAWLVIALVALTHWLLTTGVPPIVATAATAGHAAWDAIGDDPIGRGLHTWATRTTRITRPAHSPARWVRRRLGLTPAGLPLTLAVTIAASSATALTVLARRVEQRRSPVSLFDLRVAEVASRLQLGGERRVMEAITNIGGTRSVLLIAALLVTGALAARNVRGAVLLVVTLALSSGLVTVLKASHARPRPALGQLVETSTSFPSGHAAAALSLAFGTLLWWLAAGRRRTSLLAAVVVPLALLIGFSRAYLSIHWTSDVVAGWLCATIAAAFVLAGDRLTISHWRSPATSRPRALVGAGTAAALVVGVVLVTGNHQFPRTVPPEERTRLASTTPADLIMPLPRHTHPGAATFGRSRRRSMTASSGRSEPCSPTTTSTLPSTPSASTSRMRYPAPVGCATRAASTSWARRSARTQPAIRSSPTARSPCSNKQTAAERSTSNAQEASRTASGRTSQRAQPERRFQRVGAEQPIDDVRPRTKARLP